MTQPLVSVVIPTHNSGRHVSEALGSVFGQDYRPLEVIVVDDGSSDDTYVICRRYPEVRYVYQENSGPAVARNAGIRLARGPYVAFLDADDLWPEGKLAAQVEMMKRHSEVALLSGDMQRFSEGRATVPSMFERDGFDRDFFGDDLYVREAYRKLVAGGNYIPTGTVLVRKACIEEVGGFDERFRRCEDLDLWLRLALRYKLGYTRSIWLLRRDHGSNLTRDSASMTLALLQVLAKHEGEYRALWCRTGVNLGTVIAVRQRNLAYMLLYAGRPREARRHFGRSLLREFHPKAAFWWCATFLGTRGVQLLRKLARDRGRGPSDGRLGLKQAGA